MDPSFAESPVSRRMSWLVGGLAASVLTLVAMRPCPVQAVRTQPSFEQFENFRPVKKCVGGRWVYARHQHDAARISNRY